MIQTIAVVLLFLAATLWLLRFFYKAFFKKETKGCGTACKSCKVEV